MPKAPCFNGVLCFSCNIMTCDDLHFSATETHAGKIFVLFAYVKVETTLYDFNSSLHAYNDLLTASFLHRK